MSSRIDNITESSTPAKVFYYSCRSVALDLYNIPFFATCDQDAVRAIIDKAVAAHDPSLTYGLLNCDIQLVKLASFNYEGYLNNEFALVADEKLLRDKLLNLRKDLQSYVDNLPKEVNE